MTKTELDSWTRNSAKDIRRLVFHHTAGSYSPVKETTDYIYNEWLRSRENHIKNMLEYGRRPDMGIMGIEININNIRDALARYGYVTNCEVAMSGLNHAPMMHIDVDLTGAYFDNQFCPTSARPLNNPKPKKVMFNGPATIVDWTDDTKTIVKCMDGEEFDPEKGLAMAICKRLYGKDFHRVFRETLKNAETRKGNETKLARAARVAKAKKKAKAKQKGKKNG